MTPPPSEGGHAADQGRDHVRAAPAVFFRRVPLFWKILLSNATVLALGVLAGGLTVLGLGQTGAGSVTGVVVAAGVGVLLVSVAVNAVLIRLALSPIEDLHEAAEEVLAGRLDARSTTSPYADRNLRHLVSAFNNMLDSLALHHRRQQELARRVLEAEERERGLIAHELFSRTAQTLAGVLVRLRVAERHVSNGGSEALREIRQGTVDALEEIRGVARRLRPPELDELGVGAALEAHARSMTEGTDTEVQFDGTLPALSRETSLALFRIVQEAVNNAVLHGRPDHIRISFRTRGDHLVAEVADDGTGFDLEDSLGNTTDSLGLFGMHERAGYVHGELAVESGPGQGTVVRVTVPVRPMEGERAASMDGAVERLVEGLVEGPSHQAGVSRPKKEPVTV